MNFNTITISVRQKRVGSKDNFSSIVSNFLPGRMNYLRVQTTNSLYLNYSSLILWRSLEVKIVRGVSLALKMASFWEITLSKKIFRSIVASGSNLNSIIFNSCTILSENVSFPESIDYKLKEFIL
mmetsp:Transcript_4370/g.3660  ORF Transcript_4370/g.3660 Transcript_4370/m.3660 type:complete len:125 (+) Transcript_4370:171-545(+)